MQVDIPKGYSSEKFLFQKVFIPKGHYSKKVLSQRVIIPKIFILKDHYSEIRNTLWDKNLWNNVASV